MSNDALKAELEKRRTRLIRRNKRIARWQRRWAEIVVFLLFIYVALPFVAPTLMQVGATGAGNTLYTIYSPMCHQFAFRSFFLFGEQSTYPREVAGSSAQVTFDERALQSEKFVQLFEEARRSELRRTGSPLAETYTLEDPADLDRWSSALQMAARRFRGDEKMGYKVALCERDIAIYGAMVIGGIAYLPVRRRLRPAPVWLYVLLGLGPIGLDGFSQLLSYPPFEFWEVRETLPEFRVLTGALFGLMNIWLAFPYLERSMIESSREMEKTINAIESEQMDR